MTVSDGMDRQAELSARRVTLVANCRKAWAKMIREWSAPRQTDAVWLMYAGNYLFHTLGLKWAVDPVLLRNRVPEAPLLDVRQDLSRLSFVLLTHAHADHIDLRLWDQLSGLDCHWIVPEHMLSLVIRETSLPRDRFSVAAPSTPIQLDGVRVVPFSAPHYEQQVSGEITGVPATGYLVEIGESRYLLPGDIRTYDVTALPSFGPVTAVFSHVFLGRAAALQHAPPLIDAFVEFYRAFRPEKILLTHLYEISRGPADCWCRSHAQRVKSAFDALDDETQVIIPEWYQEIAL